MAIYDADGNDLNGVAYDADGNRLYQAYDADGNQLITDSSLALKVMTYNVGQWYLGNHDNVPADKDAEYYALQNGMISSNNADILFLEEYTLQFSKAGRTALSLLQQYYPYIHERGISNPSASSGAYCCLCSKYPFSNYVHHTFSNQYGMYYDTCNMNIGGKEVFVVITHLYWAEGGESVRASEAQEILNAINDKPYFIVAGDFNTWDFYSKNGVDYIQVIKPFVDRGYHIANGGDFGFLQTFQDHVNYDYDLDTNVDNIITSVNIPITNAYVDTTKLTDSIDEKVDHMPLVATIEIPM